jgi:hypothetical protein
MEHTVGAHEVHPEGVRVAAVIKNRITRCLSRGR